MTRNEITERLGISHPILQAPMAGGTTTPELVAAVSNAGALGSLGAAYLTPEQLIQSIQKIRAITDRPFNVNLFAGGYEAEPKRISNDVARPARKGAVAAGRNRLT